MVWVASEKASSKSVVLLMIISKQNQFQNIWLQVELNNNLKAGIDFKHQHTLLMLALFCTCLASNI